MLHLANGIKRTENCSTDFLSVKINWLSFQLLYVLYVGLQHLHEPNKRYDSISSELCTVCDYLFLLQLQYQTAFSLNHNSLSQSLIQH